MKISIIIPTYKPLNYIWQCLGSIKDQTFDYSEFEIIIIINGCNEPYYSKIKSYCKKNLAQNNYKIVQTDTPGVSNARNIGLNIFSGEYLTFLDDDDYISETYLSDLYKNASKSILPVTNVLAFDDNTNEFLDYYLSHKYIKNKNKKLLNLFRGRSFLSVPIGKLMHKDTIYGITFNRNLSIGEDSVFMFEVSKNIKKIRLISSKAIYYRRVRTNSATTIRKSKSMHIKICYKKIISFIRIWLKKPFKYNFLFFNSRIIAAIKILISELKTR